MARLSQTTVTNGLFIDVGQTSQSNSELNIKNEDDSYNYINIFNIIYPIGSIYQSVVNKNPKDLFNIGEWKPIPQNCFIKATNGEQDDDKNFFIENDNEIKWNKFDTNNEETIAEPSGEFIPNHSHEIKNDDNSNGTNITLTQFQYNHEHVISPPVIGIPQQKASELCGEVINEIPHHVIKKVVGNKVTYVTEKGYQLWKIPQFPIANFADSKKYKWQPVSSTQTAKVTNLSSTDTEAQGATGKLLFNEGIKTHNLPLTESDTNNTNDNKEGNTNLKKLIIPQHIPVYMWIRTK